jgi:hypothetical protein
MASLIKHGIEEKGVFELILFPIKGEKHIVIKFKVSLHHEQITIVRCQYYAVSYTCTTNTLWRIIND